MRVIREAPKGEVFKHLVRFQFQLSIEVAVSQENQISTLRKNEPRHLELLISLMIESVASSLNAKNTLNANQLDECALLIIEKYWMLRPEEILLVFKNAKLGKYGTDFNRIDILTISGWINRYIDEERTPYFERVNQQREPDLLPREEFEAQYEAMKKDRQENPEKYAEMARAEQQTKREQKRQKFVNAEKEASFQEFSDNYYKSRSPVTQDANNSQSK